MGSAQQRWRKCSRGGVGGDECQGDLGQQEWKEGLRDGSETDCDAWFGDRGADEKT